MPRRHRNGRLCVPRAEPGRASIFETTKDDAAFEKVSDEAGEQVAMRLLAFCLMPSHWHLVLWSIEDDDLSQYMRWLTNTHTRRVVA